MNGVYRAISRVTAEMAKEGIGKNRKNKEQGYQFRGIDDIYNALGVHLAAQQLAILPRILGREQTERATKSGGALFNVVVEVEFDFVCAEDGSRHTIKVYGEAMDTADKATNKAMSAAYKYACLQAFCIPTEGDNDADAHTPEVAPGGPAKPQGANPPAQSQPQPVFSGEAQLITFQAAVRAGYAKARNAAELEETARQGKADLERLFKSPVDLERDAAKALVADYNDRLAQLQAAKPAPKVRTVEDALADDIVPY